MKLSIVLTVFNEEGKIENCLKSIKNIADEIVVVDNESTDRTVALARNYTKNIFSRKNNPQEIDLQKNFGFQKASGDWILSLDADERVTPELVSEIKKAMEDRSYSGYWIPRKNIIFGKWIQHTGWYPDEQLRLFQNGKGKYSAKHVHEDLIIDGEVGHLQNPLIHENYQTLRQFIERNFLRYAPNEAENLLDKGYKFSYLDVLWFPTREFLSRYFAREGYKDGFHGLILSLLLASYHLMIFAYIWEKKKFITEDENFSTKSVKYEAEKIAKEFHYWFVNEIIKNTKNPIKKVLLKAQRKLS